MSTDKTPLATMTGAFSTQLQEINAAKAILAQLEAQASVTGDLIMKGYGKGPHPVQIPDTNKPGAQRTLVVVFQRVAKAVRFETTDVTDLVASMASAAPITPTAAPEPGPDHGDPLARIKAASGT